MRVVILGQSLEVDAVAMSLEFLERLIKAKIWQLVVRMSFDDYSKLK